MAEEIGTDLLVLVPQGPQALEAFSGDFGSTIEPLLAGIKRAVDSFTGDISTEEGREAIKSFAFKLARSKTALDNAGKAVNDDLKRLPKLVDANRRRAWDLVESWQTKVRAPLTAWEDAEKARKDKHLNTIQALNNFERGASTSSDSRQLRSILSTIQGVVVDATCEEFEGEYRIAKDAAIGSLTRAIEVAEKAEAQAAELARLRAAEAAREAEERQRVEAERLRERERQEEERRQREAADRELAEARRQTEQANARAVAAELEAERIKKDAEEREAYAQWQAREEKRQAEEAKHRKEADAERRESIEGKIAMAIATVIKQFSGEMTEVQASEIVDAVIDGKIPHLRIDYA